MDAQKKATNESDFKKMESELRGALEPIFSRYLPEAERKEAIENLYELNRPSFRSILVNSLKI